MADKRPLLRVRFRTGEEDYRPAVWPVPHPYWCTGSDADDNHIVVAYADHENQILEQWPEAFDLDATVVEGYAFSSRFPRPEWLEENGVKEIGDE